MRKSKHSFKRAQPALGTLASIELFDVERGAAQKIFPAVFLEIARLERILSKFSPESDVAKVNGLSLNADLQPETNELLSFVRELEELSERAFCATQPLLDLSGVAKGYIIDAAVTEILRLAPQASGVVNCGGDLRFFNRLARPVTLRFGRGRASLSRQLNSLQDAVASSCPADLQDDALSSTIYTESSDRLVTVMAGQAMLADALTKVGLFASAPIFARCCRRFLAQGLVFSKAGELLDSYGI